MLTINCLTKFIIIITILTFNNAFFFSRGCLRKNNPHHRPQINYKHKHHRFNFIRNFHKKIWEKRNNYQRRRRTIKSKCKPKTNHTDYNSSSQNNSRINVNVKKHGKGGILTFL